MSEKLIKKTASLSIFFFVFIFFVIAPNIIHAQNTSARDTYTLLAPLPCVGGDDTCAGEATETDITKYIPGVFNLAIGLSAAFAVLNLVWGGFQYLSTDAVQGKSEGKSRLSHSITGLILVIGAWLILYTVNPKLLEISFDLETVVVNPTYGAGGTITTIPGTSCAGSECGKIMGIAIGNTGDQLHPATLVKIQALNEDLKTAGIGWTITEAYPPKLPQCSATVTTLCHVNTCHAQGTCIDADISNSSDANIKKFLDFAKSRGLKAVWETTPAEEARLLRLFPGYTVNIKSYSHITGSHFSVYNQ